MAIHYLTFNKHARLYSWLQQHRDLCLRVTGENPVECIAKPIAPIDLKALPYTHANFTPRVQWFINKHCPYHFARSGKAKKHHILLIIKDWYYYKIKKGS